MQLNFVTNLVAMWFKKLNIRVVISLVSNPKFVFDNRIEF